MAQNGLGQPIVDRNGNIKTDHKLVPEVLYDSATRIPIALIHQGINKYMEIVNSSADRYLAVIGLDPNTEEAKYKEHVKKAAKNFTAYMRVLLQSSGDIIKEGLDVFSKLMQDPEFKSVFDKFLQSLQESIGLFTEQILALGDKSFPKVKDMSAKYVNLMKSTGESAGKAGINAGLNAMQAVPILGQGLSIIRMIHSITMPFFIFVRKMLLLVVKTAEDIIKINAELQPKAMIQLRGYILLVENALKAQDVAARKILNISNNFQEKIQGTKSKLNNITANAGVPQETPIQPPPQPQTPPQPVKVGGGRKKKSRRRRRRTKKRSLKKRHRRKSRRRKRRKSRR